MIEAPEAAIGSTIAAAFPVSAGEFPDMLFVGGSWSLNSPIQWRRSREPVSRSRPVPRRFPVPSVVRWPSIEDEIASIFAGSGETRGLMRRVDWSSTSLGPPETWPQSLRSALSICLGSRCPICLYWGADYILLYNDAWIPIPGAKHPWALGRTAAEVWPEIWGALKPIFDAVIAPAEGDRADGIRADEAGPPMPWDGAAEKGRVSEAVSPIRGEGGAVVGLFSAAAGWTAKGASERPRLLLLERLVDLQEQERLRVARELHDQMGQDLAGLSLGMKNLEASIVDENGRQTLRWLQNLTAQIGRNVHRTASGTSSDVARRCRACSSA